jgi:hypothetical protein
VPGQHEPRQCAGCLGWGVLGRHRRCPGCEPWAKLHTTGVCARCRHPEFLSHDGLCRACLRAIRLEIDTDWLTAPVTAPLRARQLSLIVTGLNDTHAQPLAKAAPRAADGRVRKALLEHQRALQTPPRDDPRLCPPVLPGQLALIPVRRRLTLELARRVADRTVAGYADLVLVAVAYADKHGYSKPWKHQLKLMLRLALIACTADGYQQLTVATLGDLHAYRLPLLDILCQADSITATQAGEASAAGMQARAAARACKFRIPGPPPITRSCADCQAWIATVHALRCEPCRRWRKMSDRYRLGVCARCHRGPLPLNDHQRCRGCHTHLSDFGSEAANRPWTQLWISAAFGHKRRQLPRAGGDLAQRESSHLINPAQQTLFDVARDWSALAFTRRAELPAATPAAAILLADLATHAKDHGWTLGPAQEAQRTLAILVCWLGADTPLAEDDIHRLAAFRSNMSARRVSQFLEARGLLRPDPARRVDLDQRYIEDTIDALPPAFAAEAAAWIRVLRGHGRRSHRQRDYTSIRRYIVVAKPILTQWGQQVTSLREVTTDDVKAAIASRQGNPARAIHIVLRSLFRALRQERLIFRDPTRGLVFSAVHRLPPSVPSDLLPPLLERAITPAQRLVVLLIAVHALPGYEITALDLGDLDLSAGRLTVRRSNCPRVIWLDPATHQAADDWLRDRHLRWPHSTNRHLLVNTHTAMDTRNPPITGLFPKLFGSLGLTMQQVRQDRILYEARQPPTQSTSCASSASAATQPCATSPPPTPNAPPAGPGHDLTM